ncbi:MAG: cyclase family protein [Sphingomonas sp.]
MRSFPGIARLCSRRWTPLVPALAMLLCGCGPAAAPAPLNTLWTVYEHDLAGAKYIDLTHAFSPSDPRGTGFGAEVVAPARAAIELPGFMTKGQAFSYEGQGAAITAYTLPTDQIGTQLDPPAHGNPLGATISDVPATVAVRPLVVIDVSAKTAADPGYIAQVSDVVAWEARHGRIPAGAVVMFRTDWSKRWGDAARFTARPFPGIALDALKLLHLERHILFHGHEPLDTDATPDLVAERWLLTHDFAQAEGVANLDQVPQAGALVSIGFAKPLGGSGGLARFIAIAPADWPHGTTIAQASGAPLPGQPAPLVRGPDNVLRARASAGRGE